MGVSLLVIIASFSGYLIYQNGVKQKNSNVGETNSPLSPSDQNPVEVKPGEKPADGQYLVLNDWGVKFKIPNGLSSVKYYYNDEYDSYDFTTERVEALGGQCKEPPEYPVPGVIRLISLMRNDNPVEEGQPTGLVGVPLNDNKPLGVHYYRYNSAQSSCTNGPDDQGFQGKDRDLLRNMVNGIELK